MDYIFSLVITLIAKIRHPISGLSFIFNDQIDVRVVLKCIDAFQTTSTVAA